MDKEKFLGKALTFDDVTVVPRKSEVLPSEVSTESYLTKNIKIKIPLISAAMDTVTESRMAIAMAREGGIGIIHKNLSVEEQASEVDKVKRSENGIITDPINLGPDASLRDALSLMDKFRISGIPIVVDRKLVGILTNRDIRFETDYDQKVAQLMTKDNLVTAAVGTSLEEAKAIFKKHRIEKLPLVDENYNLMGLITIKDIQKVLQFPLASKDKKGRLMVGAAVGTSGTMKRVDALMEAGVDLIAIDSAHGHHIGVINAVREIKKNYPNIDVMAGNVVTPEATLDLIEAGADAVKVGMGPGSICTTREIGGVGIPQVSAIYECAQRGKMFGIPIVGDGGIRYSGDVVKAIVAGASSIMVGKLFAEAEESPGEMIISQGKRYKEYRGMGSMAAMKKGGKDRYFQEGQSKLVPEGIEGRVTFRGSLSNIVYQLVGGLRAGMGYCGCKNIEELQTETQFREVTNAGLRESHPHDIQITNEAPNYSIEK